MAVGSTPAYSLRRETDASHCRVRFVPGGVLGEAAGGESALVIAREGIFHGFCGEEPEPTRFEAWNVDTVNVSVSHWQGNRPELELDSARPEEPIAITASPRDRCGLTLSTGESSFYARWTLGEGCKESVKPHFPDGHSSNDGYEQPNDTVWFAPVAPGTCQIGVTYLGASTSVTLTVK